jgi:hypothetical protein
MRGVGACVKAAISAATKRLAKLRAVTGETQGPYKDVLRPFYLALIQSKLLYAATAWWDNASESCESSLEHFHKLGAATITGVSKFADTNDTLQEADHLPFDTIVIIRRLRPYLKAVTRGGYF